MSSTMLNLGSSSCILGAERHNEEGFKAYRDENMTGRIAAVHISDYHLKEEEHLLPGEGEIKWDKITDKLFALEFKGIFMYEPGVKKDTGERYTAKEVADNFINVILQKKKTALRSFSFENSNFVLITAILSY